MSKKHGYCFAKFSLSIVIASALIIASSLGCHPTSNDTESNAATEREGIEPLQLTDANFQKEVIESVMPVFVDSWAPWCPPCIEMKPTIRQLTKDLQGSMKVAELNIDENAFIKAKYEIDQFPTVLIFKHGIEVKRLIGFKTIEELHSAIRSAIDSESRQEKAGEL